MSQRPREPLDARERELAALLARAHGRADPPAELDARILAAARAAAEAPATPARPRRSLVVPATLAASLVLALGLAWQLRQPPGLPLPPPALESAEQEAVENEPAGPPGERPVATPMPEAPPPVAVEKPAPARQRITAPADAPRTQATPAPAGGTSEAPPIVAGMAPSPPAPAPMAAEMEASAEASAAMAKAATHAREAPTGAAVQAARATRPIPMPAPAVAADALGEPDEDVPPATADAPGVRDAWLRRIEELLHDGRLDDARESLAEFRRRYPDATLPPELHKLAE